MPQVLYMTFETCMLQEKLWKLVREETPICFEPCINLTVFQETFFKNTNFSEWVSKMYIGSYLNTHCGH